MLHLLLLSGLLVGVLPCGICAPRETRLGEEQPLESVVSLNESCREQVLQHVASAVLPLLRLERPPRIAADTMPQLRDAWTKESIPFPALSVVGQHHNISSNQTLLIRRGGCAQISHRITLDDLGWQSWVLHPDSFVFTQCLGCHCHQKEARPPLPLWVQDCGLGQPNPWLDMDEKKRRCCRPRRNTLPFAFLKADGSLVVQPVRLVQDCFCRA
ncbi:uncharacterized protein LOC134412316 [Elgaria multicarinata webbii]|uniref:uncharacterized protein LOC134412316 n=1 Tax=Elgaria multicarinata webbii TaxID=159646 RepID=UPI002FCD48AF